MATNVSTLCCSACGQPLKARRAARTAGVPVATTAAEILAPVGRRKLGRDRVLLTVECLFSDGETMRLSVGRHPKDSDALALEAGRRMAILSRAFWVHNRERFARAETSRAKAIAAALAEPGLAHAAEARGDEAANAALVDHPAPPLVWHGRRLSYPAAVIERAAAQLVEARIAPADTLYADAAE